jgi:hypothetical protein
VLAQQVLNKLQQTRPPENWNGCCTVLGRLPRTDAAAAAAESEANANLMAACEAAFTAAAARLGYPETTDGNDKDVDGDAVVQLPKPRTSWSYWDDLQAAIAAGTHSEESLREDAKFLGIPGLAVPTNSAASSSDRGSITRAVLEAFGLSAGSSRVVPTVLLEACKQERCETQLVADGPDGCAALHAALKRLAEMAWEVWLPLGCRHSAGATVSKNSKHLFVVVLCMIYSCARDPAVLYMMCQRPVEDVCPFRYIPLHYLHVWSMVACALKRLAEMLWEFWLPLGLQAQRWGYGE